MKRLLKSSGFWTAIIASIVLTITFIVTDSELVVTFVAALWGIDRAGKAAEDFIKTNKGVQYNPDTQRNEMIK